jgi:hypothetical protein
MSERVKAKSGPKDPVTKLSFGSLNYVDADGAFWVARPNGHWQRVQSPIPYSPDDDILNKPSTDMGTAYSKSGRKSRINTAEKESDRLIKHHPSPSTSDQEYESSSSAPFKPMDAMDFVRHSGLAGAGLSHLIPRSSSSSSSAAPAKEPKKSKEVKKSSASTKSPAIQTNKVKSASIKALETHLAPHPKFPLTRASFEPMSSRK